MAKPEAAPNIHMNAIMHPKQPFSKMIVDDQDVGLKIVYIGDQASASVEVSSAGDLTFKHGAAGSLAVDPTIDSGGDDDGVIDVSDANANTFGEVVDLINASPNWRAYLVDVLRADSSNASTGSLLEQTAIVLAPYKASSPMGVTTQQATLYKDTSKVLNMSIRVGVRQNVGGDEAKGAAEIYSITSKNTFGSGTNKIQIYEIDEAAKTETKVYDKAGGATTVEDSKTFVTNGRGQFATSQVGKHLLVRMIGSAALTGELQVVGAVDKGE